MNSFMRIASSNGIGWLAATALAIGVAGCGGSSSDGSGNGGTSLSGEQQAAMAAMMATGTASMAQGQVGAVPGNGGSGDSSGNTSSQPLGDNGDEIDICEDIYDGTGTFEIYDDVEDDYDEPKINYDFDGGRQEVVAESDLDEILGDEGGDEIFDGTVSGGNFENAQFRMDCTGDDINLIGAMDSLRYESGDMSVSYAAAGMLGQDSNVDQEIPPDPTEPWQATFHGQSSQSRYVMRLCEGCQAGSLDDVGTNRDAAFAFYGFMENVAPGQDGGEGTIIELGDPDDYFEMTGEDIGSGNAEVTLDGRMKLDLDEQGACPFHVSYETDKALLIENIDEEGEGELYGGKMDVTVEDEDETYTVEIEANGQVFVDGELFEASDFPEQC